jgi:hypothetical protein
MALAPAREHDVVLEGATLGRVAALLVQVGADAPAALCEEEGDVHDHRSRSPRLAYGGNAHASQVWSPGVFSLVING